VKLHNAGVLPGVDVVVDNASANTCKVYPGNSGTINGAASYDLTAGSIATFRLCDYGADKWKTL
jgi:hypothetical protein